MAQGETMKTILTLLILHTWLLADVKTEHYDNGMIKSEISYNETGERHGPYKTFFENGVIRTEGTMNQGKADGWQKVYHEDGRLYLEIELEENLAVKGYVYTDDGAKVPMNAMHFGKLGMQMKPQ
jgi:antitoxin component YwqK of YwqJK toxin-antitoxin module